VTGSTLIQCFVTASFNVRFKPSQGVEIGVDRLTAVRGVALNSYKVGVSELNVAEESNCFAICRTEIKRSGISALKVTGERKHPTAFGMKQYVIRSDDFLIPRVKWAHGERRSKGYSLNAKKYNKRIECVAMHQSEDIVADWFEDIRIVVQSPKVLWSDKDWLSTVFIQILGMKVTHVTIASAHSSCMFLSAPLIALQKGGCQNERPATSGHTT